MAAIIKKDGTMWEPSPEQILKWQGLYPAVDVYQELNAMAGWSDANPDKRKVKMTAFCNNWLNRAQQSGGRSPFAPKPPEPGEKITRTRDMTSLDDLSHDFTGTMADHLMEKFGQVFHNNGTRTTND